MQQTWKRKQTKATMKKNFLHMIMTNIKDQHKNDLKVSVDT